MKVKLLKYGKKIAAEKRKAEFLRAFKRNIEITRIVSFGMCNFSCPYCKRDCQLVDNKGIPLKAFEVELDEIKSTLIPYLKKGERLRLSGGDPVMFQKESLHLAKWTMDYFGEKISIAHNGSSLKFVKSMAPYLEYAAIDFKGYSVKELSFRAGISEKYGEIAYKSTLDIQNFLASEGIIVDIRTPVFNDTDIDKLFYMGEKIYSGDIKNKFWTLRAYNPVRWVDWKGISQDKLLKYAQILSQNFPQLPIGLRLKWINQREFIIFKNGKRI